MSIHKRFSRRAFLKTAAAASLAPLVLPARIRSAGVRANDRITLGFVGTGKHGLGLLGAFLKYPQTQVLAVCDVDANRRERAKQVTEDHYAAGQPDGAFTGCAACGDFRELIGRKDLDAVVIATPDHWHAAIAVAAANSKKDIYCEKPLCQSIRQSQAMVRAVRRNKIVFQTGSMQRSSTEFRTACELVRNGIIGKITSIEVSVGGPGVPCDLPAESLEPGLDWNMWLGPAPLRGYHSELSPRGVHDHYPNWRRYREYGGGMVTDWGAHHFDIAQWALGMDASGPNEIIPPEDWETAKNGARLRYASGAEVIHTTGDNEIWFHGTEGRIFVKRRKFEFWMGEEKKAGTPEECDAVNKAFLADAKVRLYRSTDHKADWLDCIRSRKAPICGVDVGAHTVIACHLVNLAYYHGQRLEWNPERQRFAGGTGNKEWLDVPQREPWKVT